MIMFPNKSAGNFSREEKSSHSSVVPGAGVIEGVRLEMATHKSTSGDNHIAKLLRMLTQLDPMEHQKETDRR